MKPQTLANDCWSRLRKKQFEKIAKKAQQNNIELQLRGEKPSIYPYGIKREYGSFHSTTDCISYSFRFPTKVMLYPAPAQERYFEMLRYDDVMYFETKEEQSTTLKELEIAERTFREDNNLLDNGRR